MSKATPNDAPAVRESRVGARRSKANYTPLIAGIAAVVIAIAGVGYYMRIKSGNANTPAQQGEVSKTAALNQPVASSAIMLPRELERIASMPDTTPDQARAVLNELARLDSAARLAEDSTFVRYRYMRGKAMFASGNRSGCDSLNSIQSKIERSPGLKRPGAFLLGVCAQR